MEAKDIHRTGNKTVTIRCGLFELLPDGVIIGKPTSVDMEIADARELVATVKQLTPSGQGVRIMLDQRGVKRTIKAPARAHLMENAESYAKIAILVGNTVSRFFAASVLTFTGFANKARVFDSEMAALAWLRSP